MTEVATSGTSRTVLLVSAWYGPIANLVSAAGTMLAGFAVLRGLVVSSGTTDRELEPAR